MKILVTALLLFAAPAWAGRLVGNAAHVLVFKNQRAVQLLDFWEAENNHGFKLMAYPDQSYRDIVTAVIARVRPRLPMLADQLAEEFKFFEANNVPLTGVLPELPPYVRRIPDDATVQTSALQRDPLFPGEKLYTFATELRERMDEFTYAGQSTHEILYRRGIENGLDNPVGIRYLTGLLFAEQGADETDVSWISGMVNSRLDLFQIAGQWIPLFAETYVPCDPVPGRVEACAANLPGEAPKTYGEKGELVSVAYAQPRAIPLASAGGVGVTVTTNALRIARRGDSTYLKFEGRIALKHGDHAPKSVQVSGYYDLATHQFCGKVGQARARYCGPVTEVAGQSRAATLERVEK